jgi:hypothetical protein
MLFITASNAARRKQRDIPFPEAAPTEQLEDDTTKPGIGASLCAVGLAGNAVHKPDAQAVVRQGRDAASQKLTRRKGIGSPADTMVSFDRRSILILETSA